ncbi:hypothetical protein A6J40_10390 [Legionella longbeachae]|nr:hypothetical protein A6J40_10390 [Legionella longbeachae]EEZ96467.1 hypothetical protein LLB_1663 [Legionella longbeachae D-4968]
MYYLTIETKNIQQKLPFTQNLINRHDLNAHKLGLNIKQKLIKCVDKSQSAIILLYTNTGIRVFTYPPGL